MSARLATDAAMPSASRSFRVAATTTWIGGTRALGSDSVKRFIRQSAESADSSWRARKDLVQADREMNPLDETPIHPKTDNEQGARRVMANRVSMSSGDL